MNRTRKYPSHRFLQLCFSIHPYIPIRGPSVRRSVSHPSALFAWDKGNWIKMGLIRVWAVWAGLGRSGQIWANMGKLSVFINRYIQSFTQSFFNRFIYMLTYEIQWMHRCLPVRLVFFYDPFQNDKQNVDHLLGSLLWPVVVLIRHWRRSRSKVLIQVGNWASLPFPTNCTSQARSCPNLITSPKK